MKRFNSDYIHGAHPAILERLCETNMEETPGYGKTTTVKEPER